MTTKVALIFLPDTERTEEAVVVDLSHRSSRHAFFDVDTPPGLFASSRSLSRETSMSDFFEERVAHLRESGEPFAIATVIAVRGSASAKPGSKALIDQAGKNIWGWVGGGCAESFVAQNAVRSHARETYPNRASRS